MQSTTVKALLSEVYRRGRSSWFKTVVCRRECKGKEEKEGKEGKGRERKGKEGKGRERKGKEGKGRERKGKEGKGRERKGKERNAWEKKPLGD